MIVTLAFLALPSWVARFMIRREKIGWKGLEDLGIGALFLALYAMLPKLSLVVIPLLQCLILFDAYLERKTHLRLERTYVTLIPQWKEFIDSAKQLNMHRFFPLALGLSILFLFAKHPSFSFWMLGAACIPFVTGTGGKKHLFLHLLSRPPKPTLNGEDPTHFLSKNEESKLLHPQYPLYRYLEGFHGEKTFDLRVDKGEKPHILFLFIESLGAQNLRIPGVTPHLDRLMQEGIYFPHFYSNSIQTFRALYAALYGLPAAPNHQLSLDPKLAATGLIDLLKGKGYQASFFNGASWALNNLKMFLKSHGADTLVDSRDIKKACPEVKEFSWGIFDEYLFQYVLDYFLAHQDTPQFGTLMTISTHHPYVLPPYLPQKAGSDREKFLSTLSYTDQCVGTFIEKLDREGVLENTLLFIMGDHGDMIQETFLMPSQTTIENYHVPLIIYGKGRGKGGQVVDMEGSQADLMPTVMDLLHLSGETHALGKSLQRAETHPIFLYNYLNHRDYHVRQGQGESFAQAYRDFLLNIHTHNQLMPLKKKERKTAHLTFPKGISEEEVLSRIEDAYSIDLGYQPHVTDRTLKRIAEVSSHLGILNLEMCFSITDQGVREVVAKCPDLLELNISHCPLISHHVVDDLLQSLHLDALIIDGLDFVTDEWVASLAFNMKWMMRLSLAYTYIKDVAALIRVFPYLETAFFSYSLISHESLIKLLEKGKLHRLNLFECQKLTDETFLQILEAGKQLKYLVLTDCHGVTDAAFLALKEMRLNTLILIAPTNLTDRGLDALLKLSIPQLEIRKGIGLTEKGIQHARKSAVQFAHLRIDGGSPF
ncbi:MAG: sulfatase-like hydrolase/transferase [Chlamydiia bacterium]|nr:sulfatase-like hydrolase/transferase [Chlamydiia bacterium]